MGHRSSFSAQTLAVLAELVRHAVPVAAWLRHREGYRSEVGHAVPGPGPAGRPRPGRGLLGG